MGIMGIKGGSMMEECYCPSCGVIKCPRQLWGGECDCDYGPCSDCDEG
jgi:hypothetical protein